MATYGPGGRFAMTDRGRAALHRCEDTLRVGPSAMRWVDGGLVIDIDEIASPPLIGRLRGRIALTPTMVTDTEVALTPDGAHVWRPFAPAARIEVDLDRGHRWSGHGYFDANFGTRALEQDFATWSWGRFPVPEGAACFYDAVRADGSKLALGLRFDAQGVARRFEPPPAARLPRSLWALGRSTRADAGYQPRQVLAMLDAPFYNRAAVRTRIDGVETTGVHEALDLRRFASPWLKPMLAVRVPRRAGWRG